METKYWEMPESLATALAVAERHITDVQENTPGEPISEVEAAEELIADILVYLIHHGDDHHTAMGIAMEKVLTVAEEKAKDVTGLKARDVTEL